MKIRLILNQTEQKDWGVMHRVEILWVDATGKNWTTTGVGSTPVEAMSSAAYWFARDAKLAADSPTGAGR